MTIGIPPVFCSVCAFMGAVVINGFIVGAGLG